MQEFKKLFNATVFGVILGVFLAGYAVFAFQAPTAVPPGGNVMVPLNAGSSDQTKTGGLLQVFNLWVNSGLGVTGGATFGGQVGIGTISPGQKLTVAGTIESTSGGFKFPDGTTQTTVPQGIPSGAVMFFNLVSCPSSWTELTGARGRYLVGLPSAGTLAGTSGTALADLESRPTGQHTHGITDPGHWHYLNDIAGYQGPQLLTLPDKYFNVFKRREITDTATTGITINPTGVPGTNAPYMQLLVCQKN